MSIVRILQLILLSAQLSTAAIAQDSARPSTNAATSATVESRALPADFPKDIPLYPGATVNGAASGTRGLGASFSTADAPDSVAEFYESELKEQGWVEVVKLTAGPATSISASKGNRVFAVGLTKGADGRTMISVGETTRPPWHESRLERDCRAAEPFEVDPVAPDGVVTAPRDLLDLEETHSSNPNDVAITEALAERTYVFGVRLMCKSTAAPGVKYPIALRFLRAALKLNPSHEGAREWVDEIESIYRSLGKPVPE